MVFIHSALGLESICVFGSDLGRGGEENALEDANAEREGTKVQGHACALSKWCPWWNVCPRGENERLLLRHKNVSMGFSMYLKLFHIHI